jgi:hypothetical protein
VVDASVFARSDSPVYFALGFGGQKIYVPEQDAIVVLTAANYSTADTTTEILTEHLLPGDGVTGAGWKTRDPSLAVRC